MRLRAIGIAVVLLGMVSCTRQAGDLGARITGLAGGVQVMRFGAESWKPVDTSEVLTFGDSIRVLNDAYAELTFGQGNTIRLEANSKAGFNDVIDTGASRSIEVYLEYGAVLSTIAQLDAPYDGYRVRTPEAVFDARGTTFVVRYELDVRNAEVDVVNGEVWVYRAESDSEPVVAMPGYFVVVPYGKPPHVPDQISFVRWRKIERIMTPSFELRRPAVIVVRDAPKLRRIRRAPPPHARPSRVVAPGVRPGRGVKVRPAQAPRVLKPAPHGYKKKMVQPRQQHGQKRAVAPAKKGPLSPKPALRTAPKASRKPAIKAKPKSSSKPVGKKATQQKKKDPQKKGGR